MIYRCAVCYAVLNVVQAVFIQQTVAQAKREESYIINAKQRNKEEFMAKLQTIFMLVDSSGDGKLNQAEFDDMMKNEAILKALSVLDIDISEARGLFKLLDDGDGEMSAEEFSSGLKRLQGGATAMDMQYVMGCVRRLEQRLEEFWSRLEGKIVF